jgi:hypothetical protein
MKTISVLKPIPEKEMPKMGWHRIPGASPRDEKETRRASPARVPMIIWKDGKVREVRA